MNIILIFVSSYTNFTDWSNHSVEFLQRKINVLFSGKEVSVFLLSNV